jgi:hypothetical protein
MYSGIETRLEKESKTSVPFGRVGDRRDVPRRCNASRTSAKQKRRISSASKPSLFRRGTVAGFQPRRRVPALVPFSKRRSPKAIGKAVYQDGSDKHGRQQHVITEHFHGVVHPSRRISRSAAFLIIFFPFLPNHKHIVLTQNAATEKDFRGGIPPTGYVLPLNGRSAKAERR